MEQDRPAGEGGEDPQGSRLTARTALYRGDSLGQRTPVPVNDMWIAAVALAHDLIVVSQNGHFQHVEGLQI
jgi:predicted nucleic acid-binding protein